MSLKILLATILQVACFSNIVLGSKLDPNLGSNWYAPSSSSISQGLVSGVSTEQVHNQVQNGQSSFIPTTNVLRTSNQDSTAIEANNRQNYNALQQPKPTLMSVSPTSGQQYQYLQHYPEGNAYHIYPVAGSGMAEQRQEFFNPNINGFPPLDGDGAIDVGGDDTGEGSVFDNFPSVGGITSGITGTASNIAQSIGLGSLGVFGSFLVLAVLAPLIILAIVFPAAILIIAILGFPVLQLTLPPTDPFLGRKLKSGVMDAARKAKQVLQSEECVERFSCELARKSRKLPYESWILEKMDKLSNTWANRVARSVKSGRAGGDCQTFKCEPMTKMKKMYDSYATATARYLGRA